jgi:succinate dehydrogenase / fumarate reductase iron-sulfur subunit
MTTDGVSTRRLRLHRYRRGDAEPHIEEHDVPVDEDTTVLSALRWIQLHRDPSLALRHSCFHASCGTCGVRVNGRERLACVTRLSEHEGTVSVDPIANLPVLHDVVVDMQPFYARFPDPHPIARSSEFLPQAETAPGVNEHERFEDCIECGLCLSACPIAAWACHAAFECTEACPSDVRPAQRIMALRRELRGRRRRQGREIPEAADEEARS